jgi:hypothetical protein
MVHQHAVRDSNLYSDRDPDGHVGYLHPNVHTNHDPHADNDKHPNPDLHGDSDRDADGDLVYRDPERDAHHVARFNAYGVSDPRAAHFDAYGHPDRHLVYFYLDVDPYGHRDLVFYGVPHLDEHADADPDGMREMPARFGLDPRQPRIRGRHGRGLCLPRE